MTPLQAICADVAQLQAITSNTGLARMQIKQRGPRPGFPTEPQLRAGLISAGLQLRIYADRFAAVVTHRAAANDASADLETA